MRNTFQTLASGAALVILAACSDHVHASCTTERGSGTVSNGLDSWEITLTKPDGAQAFYSRGTETHISGKAIISAFCATGENPTPLREELRTLTDYTCTSKDGERSAYVQSELHGFRIGDESGNEALVQKSFGRLVVSARNYCAGEKERSPVAAPF